MEQIRAKTGIPWHSTTNMCKLSKDSISKAALDQAKLTDVPLLQYTSGSTSKITLKAADRFISLLHLSFKNAFNCQYS